MIIYNIIIKIINHAINFSRVYPQNKNTNFSNISQNPFSISWTRAPPKMRNNITVVRSMVGFSITKVRKSMVLVKYRLDTHLLNKTHYFWVKTIIEYWNYKEDLTNSKLPLIPRSTYTNPCLYQWCHSIPDIDPKDLLRVIFLKKLSIEQC